MVIIKNEGYRVALIKISDNNLYQKTFDLFLSFIYYMEGKMA